MINCRETSFSGHAIRRMFQRSITTGDVSHVLRTGEIIARYPEDQPLPSYLVLGMVMAKPLHVVVAVDLTACKCYIVTAYAPDADRWESDFKTRRSL
jgi:hypothetical protein